MGVYIKDMEMPTERESFQVTIKYNGVVLDTETGIQVAEAFSVPDHGRLIDADATEIYKREELALARYNENQDDEFLEGVKDGWHEAAKCLSCAPTIIEAEEGE